MQAHWSNGTAFALPIGVAATLGLLAGGVAFAVYHKKHPYRDADLSAFACLTLASALVVALLITLFPYHVRYHRWEPVVVAIGRVDEQFQGGDGGATTYVITGDDGAQYLSTDPRIASYATGERVGLSCIWRYERTAADWRECDLGNPHG